MNPLEPLLSFYLEDAFVTRAFVRTLVTADPTEIIKEVKASAWCDWWGPNQWHPASFETYEAFVFGRMSDRDFLALCGARRFDGHPVPPYCCAIGEGEG